MKRRLLISMVLLIMMAESACFARSYPIKAAVAGPTANKTNNAAESSQAKKAGENTADEKAAKDNGTIIDHTCIKLDQIPLEWIEKAKKDLHIAYGHTSHGSQITNGLLALTKYLKGPYIYKVGSPEDSIDLRDNPFGSRMDLGAPNNKAWTSETRKYLENNKDVNVVMWSWCGQLSSASSGYVQNYLDLMQKLEKDFPKVRFVYMTGHLDGKGESKTLGKNNKQIREFCSKNNKLLYDFADIESYNPDGVYFGDKYANDACEYDSNGDKKPDKNWALEWQDAHKKDVDWFECNAAHSQPVNANMKAYAAWWLMARLAGWDGTVTGSAE